MNDPSSFPYWSNFTIHLLPVTWCCTTDVLSWLCSVRATSQRNHGIFRCSPSPSHWTITTSWNNGGQYTILQAMCVNELWISVTLKIDIVRDISLTTWGGDRPVRQNSPAIFGDTPPIISAWKSAIPPIRRGLDFVIPPHYRGCSLTCTIHWKQLSGVATQILRILMHQPSHKWDHWRHEEWCNSLDIAGKAAKLRFFLLDFDWNQFCDPHSKLILWSPPFWTPGILWSPP